MISSTPGKKIRIYITTYKQDCKEKVAMDDRNNKKPCRVKCNLCSICLNSKPENEENECNKIINKSCPICTKNCDHCHTTPKRDKGRHFSPENAPNVKNVQTSDTNVAQGLHLLNEVLTVFQNKKEDINREKIKSVPSKDVGVVTDSTKDTSTFKITSFYYSIDEWKRPENGIFIIVNSYQPNFVRKSHYSLDLIKHKSSSIPQMKLEELQYSVKQKSRSKDAIEEVNRMFATVRKTNKHVNENSNRPMIRNGPRVLPVVKSMFGHDTYSANVESLDKSSCRCCQTCMPSGDTDCCYDLNSTNCDKNDKFCCHYQNKRKIQADTLCECCRNLKDKNYYCEHANYDDC